MSPSAGEIRGEMAAKQMSGRTLSEDPRLMRSHNYLAVRLRGEKAFDLSDLERITTILDLDPREVIARAEARVAAESTESAKVSRPKFGAGRRREDMWKVDDEAAWDED